jgi:hypothetical protein
VYCSGHESATITLTVLDYPSFKYLALKFDAL